MQTKKHSTARSLGVCRRLYNFAMAILGSCALPNSLPQEHSTNNEDSDIMIEFSETKHGKKTKIGSTDNSNVKIKFKPYEKQSQGGEPSLANGIRERGGARRETNNSPGKVKQKYSKERPLHEEEDEDETVVIPRDRIPTNVFLNVDARAEDFIRSRLEAMRRSH